MKKSFILLFLLLVNASFTLQVTAQSFTELNQSFAPTYFGAAVWADYDQDGNLDFFVNGWEVGSGSSNPTAYLYRNNGDNTFSEVTHNIMPLGAATAAWGDFNNDGFPDLAIAGNAGNNIYASKIYRNNGDGTFTDINAALTPVITPAIAWGDVNNDGLQDLFIVGGQAGSVASSKLYLNNGDETFIETPTSIDQLTNGAVAIGDLNKDGLLDIVIAGRLGSFNYISKVYINQGDAVFEEMPISLEPARYASIALADYSGDGFLDILIAGSNNNDLLLTRLYKNINGESFVYIPTPMTGIIQGSVAWGDVNNDGLNDVLLTGSNVSTGATRVTEVFLNQGNDVFVKDNNANLPGLRRSTAYWGDYNNDGKLDVLAAGYFNVSDYLVKIFINNTPIANTVPETPQNLQSAVAGGSAVLSWDASTDAQTASNSLTYNIRIGSSPGASDIVSSIADLNTGFRFIPENGNTGTNLQANILGLDEGTYFWSVQAIDGALAGSAFAQEQVFIVSDLLTATFQVSSDGLPLEGASVQIGTQTKETNSEGLATFSLSPGNYDYTVSHPFHIAANGSFSIGDQSITIPVALIPLPTFELTFSLTNTSGPVENAVIEINNQALTSNAAGEAVVTLLEGTYTYYIYEHLHNQIWGEVAISENTVLNLDMIPLEALPLPFNETFDQNILPLHWQKFDESGSGYEWFFENQRAIIDSDIAGSGINVHASLVSAPIDIQALEGNIMLKLHHYFEKLGSNNYARIHYSLNNEEWVLLAQFDATVGTITNFVWTEHLIEGIPEQVTQIRFRFEYNDGLIWAEQWMLEEVVVEEFNLQAYEMTLSEAKKPHVSQTPLKHFSPFTFSAKGKNTGINALENVYLNVDDQNGIVANSAQIPYFPPGFELVFNSLEAFTPQQAGTYQFLHQFLAPGIELNGSTNEAMVEITVSDSTFATENGNLEGGVGGSDVITFGNIYQLIESDKFTSFTIGWHELSDNISFTVSLFRINMPDSSIVEEVYQSELITRGPEMANQYISWNLETPVSLEPGYYALMVNQLDATSIRVGYNGEDNGLFWRKSGNDVTTFENTQWGNVAIRMHVFDDGVGLRPVRETSLIKIYPNPASDRLFIINGLEKTQEASIYTLDGKYIETIQFSPGNTTFSIDHLKSGTYVIKGETINHQLFIIK